MRTFLLVLVTGFASITVNAQKLDSKLATTELYKEATHKYGSIVDTATYMAETGQLMLVDYYKTFYFSGKEGKKEAIIMFSKTAALENDKEREVWISPNSDCHACAPLADMALYEWNGKKWTFKKWLAKNWDEAGSGWGKFGKMAIVPYKGKDALRVVFSNVYNTTETRRTYFYNPENLRLISSVEKDYKAP